MYWDLQVVMENVICSNCEVSLSRTRCLFVQCEECLSDGLDVKLCASVSSSKMLYTSCKSAFFFLPWFS